MTQIALNTQWHASGLRWIGGLFLAAADRLESLSTPTSASDELYFDSDAYLAEVRNRVYTRFY